jgi:hypothetical protein
MAALKCVYNLLNSSLGVQKVEAFSVDGFRHAIEFTIRAENGHVLTGDMMLSERTNGTFTWSVRAFHGESTEDGFEELDFLTKAIPDLDSKCHMTPAMDNLLPGPRPRSEWQRINLENSAPRSGLAH